MSGPHTPWDPDPLDATDEAYAEGLMRGWDDGWSARHALEGARPVVGLLIAALSGAIVGAALMWLLR